MSERNDEIERWAKYVRTHINWKSNLKPFLDAQIIMARRFYRKLIETEGGREKFRLLRKLEIRKT